MGQRKPLREVPPTTICEKIMALENFSLNMSQEACHLFTGIAMGEILTFKYIIVLIAVAGLIFLVKPSVQALGEKLRDKIFKKGEPE